MQMLALDLGTTTGWALESNGLTLSGSQPFKPDRFSGGGMRFLLFSKWLSDNFGHVGLVLYEEVRNHVSNDSAHAYGGYYATLTAWCESRKIPYTGVPVQTIKKHATGKGNADKRLMLAFARALGYDPKDDNEADAIHLLRYGLETFHAPPGDTLQRPAPDVKPRRRVQVEPVPVAGRAVPARARKVVIGPR